MGSECESDAWQDLLAAVDAVLRGEPFVSRRLSGHDFIGASDTRVFKGDPSK